MAFAKKYDPQPFHIDPEAAGNSLYGGLIASGWHTAAVWMKLAIAGRMNEPADGKLVRAGVSPGFEEMKWLKPVRPGMTLFYSTEVVEKVALRSRPQLGLLLSRNEARDGDGTLMMQFIGKGFVERKKTNGG
jgi:acyl dehydratase